MTTPLDPRTLDYEAAKATTEQILVFVENNDYMSFVEELNVLAKTMGLPERPDLVVYGFNDQRRALDAVRQIQRVFRDIAYAAPELARGYYMEFISYLNMLMSAVESNQPAQPRA